MKILRAIAFIILSMCTQHVMAQNKTAHLGSTTSSGTTINVGTWVTVYVAPDAGCTLTQAWFYPSPSPDQTNQISAYSYSYRWNSPVAASVSANYTCGFQSSASAQPTYYYTVADLNPDFTLGLTSTSICKNDYVTGSLSNIKNADRTNVTPNVLSTWDWSTCVGSSCTSFYNGTDKSTRQIPTGNTNVTSVRVIMTSGQTGTTVSRSVSISFKTLEDFTITDMYVPGVCKNDTGPTALGVNVSATTNNLGPFKYYWKLNNGDASPCPQGVTCPQVNPTTTNHFTYPSVQDGDRVWVEVVDQSTGKCRVISTKSTPEHLVDVIDNSYPEVKIIFSRTQNGSILGAGSGFCQGSPVWLRSSQSGTAYHWTITGYLPTTFQGKDVMLTAGPGDYNANMFISLTVDGVSASGTCVIQNTTAGPASSHNEMVVYDPPSSTITPPGSNLIKSYETRTLSTVSGMPEYQWYQENPPNSNTYTAMSGGSSQTASITNISSGRYKVKVTDALGCASTSATPTEIKRNTLPTVNAGPDVDFTQPATPAVTGASATDVEGSVTLSWTKFSGPTGTLLNPTTANVSIGGAVVGAYVLRLTATDNLGESAYDDTKLRLYPADNYNFVRENAVNVTGVTSTTQTTGLAIGDRLQTTTYFDGLGRPLQKVDMKVTPASKDLTQAFEYDQYNREVTKYLPFPSAQNTGEYLPNTVKTSGGVYTASPQQQYYNTKFSDSPGYAQSGFDNSPLNRVTEQGAPGADWQLGQHTVGKGYTYNVIHEVLNFTYVPLTGEIKLPAVTSSDAAYYSSNALYCNTTTDEQSNEVREYTDKEGRLICKKVEAPGGGYASTYYLYDEIGNLVVVIPPEGIQRVLETN
jgi:hypothetical protein